MSSIGIECAKLLLADPGVSALVGTRVRPVALDQTDTMPAIIYSIVSTDAWHALSGGTYGARSRVQFYCYGESIEDAVSVESAILNVLDGYRGRAGDLFISSSMLENVEYSGV